MEKLYTALNTYKHLMITDGCLSCGRIRQAFGEDVHHLGNPVAPVALSIHSLVPAVGMPVMLFTHGSGSRSPRSPFDPQLGPGSGPACDVVYAW